MSYSLPCPYCDATGYLEKPETISEKHKLIVHLHTKGLSHRQIMRQLGYKSPRSISFILEKNLKPSKN